MRELLISLERLLWLGGGLLTIGITAGWFPHNVPSGVSNAAAVRAAMRWGLAKGPLKSCAPVNSAPSDRT